MNRAALLVVLAAVAFGAIAFGLYIMTPGPRQPMPPFPDYQLGKIETLVELETPGGPLPFLLTVLGSAGNAGQPLALIEVGEEELWVREGDVFADLNGQGNSAATINVEFPHYDSSIRLSGRDVLTLAGTWTKKRGLDGNGVERVATLAVTTRPTSFIRPRYIFERVSPHSAPADFGGRWSVKFSSSDDLAVGVFTVKEDQTATGTFLTTTGDYRYLAGQVDGDLMRLATFDGSHAFLFHARMNDDGTITGDFWSGDWWHETWTATRDPDAQLPDAFGQTVLNEDVDLSELTFTGLDGQPVRLTDALDAQGGKARVVELFGTWCPNCADAAKEIRRLKELHGEALGVVALAFELTDDHERSVAQIARYKQRHKLADTTDWPILIAGVSDKAKATDSVRLLDRVRSYPTTLFLNDRNEVVAIHTGFSGPATGDAFAEQQRQWEAIIERLLGE